MHEINNNGQNYMMLGAQCVSHRLRFNKVHLGLSLLEQPIESITIDFVMKNYKF
jgi:hypothetical protein